MKPSRLALVGILLAVAPACTHAIVDPFEAAQGVKQHQKNSADDRESHQDKGGDAPLQVQCGVIYPGDTAESTAPCQTFAFILLSSEGEILARKFPNAQGKVEFRVSNQRQYRLQADVSEGWKVEQEPSGKVEANDQVKLRLIRIR